MVFARSPVRYAVVRNLGSTLYLRMKKEQSKKPGRMVIRWGALAGGIIIAALYLNSSIYSAWLSGGPPNEYPEAWAHRAFVHVCFSCAFLLLGIAIFRIAGSFPRVGAVSTGLVLVALLLAVTPYVRVFLDQDSCLDGGGRWSYEGYRCEK